MDAYNAVRTCNQSSAWSLDLFSQAFSYQCHPSRLVLEMHYVFRRKDLSAGWRCSNPVLPVREP
jgi:hypothetical protein